MRWKIPGRVQENGHPLAERTSRDFDELLPFRGSHRGSEVDQVAFNDASGEGICIRDTLEFASHVAVERLTNGKRQRASRQFRPYRIGTRLEGPESLPA